jgi:peptide/nickel transport system substrate-binding protein
MRERHIFWDIAPLALLSLAVILLLIMVVDNQRGWGVMQKLLAEQAALRNQNREIIAKLEGGVKIGQGAAGQPEKMANTAGNNPAQETAPTDLPPGVKPPVVPKFVRGDEGAPDGDWLVETMEVEPNSLNPLRDNDAAAASLFGEANDSLATRSFDDLSIWEPRLAEAWTKELRCEAYVKDGQAKELAKEIEKKWDAQLLQKLQIKLIAADSPDLLRIEIGDVNNSYQEQLKKDFGGRILEQRWFYLSFQGQKFLDGTELTPAVIGKRVAALVENAVGFKGKILAPVTSEDRVILRVLGDEKANDTAEKALKDYCASKENKALVVDEKSANGLREDTCLSYQMAEAYLAQEKPIFTFYLHKDVKWHDGEPFTGRDVVFTFRTIMNPKIECGADRNYYNDCESVELVNGNPYQVRFTWIKPYFQAFISSAEITILPEHLFKFTDPKEFNEGPQNQKLVGTGEYRLEKWDRGSQFVFVRNENYYRRKPHLKRVIYTIVKDRTAELQLFEAGETDIHGLTPPQMHKRESDTDFRNRFGVNISTANVYRYVGWNARLDLFKDKRVRQALTMLIDQKRICKDIYYDYASPIYGTVHPDNPAYWKDLPKHAWPYDPERARRQLAEAGWRDTVGDGVLRKDGMPFKFTLLIHSNDNEVEAVANLIKDSFAKVGINVIINNLEWSVLLQKIERLQFDAVILGWQLGIEEDPYQLWHSSQIHEKESNFCDFVNPEADRIIEACRRELDEKKRFKMLQRFQEIILDEQPYTFLFVPKRLVAYDKRLQNVQFKLIGNDRSRWWVPLNLQKHKD